jgi:thiol-disulfide isomerase/thioredoxin
LLTPLTGADTAESHLAWVRTPRKRGGLGHMQIPILADVTKEISASYGTLLKDAGIALRGTFIIDPEGVLQQSSLNNLGVGRSVDEVLRLVAAFQYLKEHGEVCPAGWQPGAATMVPTADGAASYFEALEEGPAEEIAARVPSLTSEAAFTAAIAGPGPVVIDWYAPWCGKCRQIAPHVEALLEKHANVKFFKVDTDALPELAAKHGAQVLPTFTFWKARCPFAHSSRALAASVREVLANSLARIDAGRQAGAAAAAGLQEGAARGSGGDSRQMSSCAGCIAVRRLM